MAPEHAAWGCHVPAAVHKRGTSSEQSRAPGAQTPPHSPSSAHTYVQSAGLLHVAEESHTRNALLGVAATHCLAPGTHSPPQASFTHANWHSVAADHSPALLQVCTCVADTHWEAGGVHAPTQPPPAHR